MKVHIQSPIPTSFSVEEIFKDWLYIHHHFIFSLVCVIFGMPSHILIIFDLKGFLYIIVACRMLLDVILNK